MLIAAAVCPHPPLLIPAATGVPGPGPGAGQLTRLRAACHQAVATLSAAAPEMIVVVGGAGRTGEYPPQTPGSLRRYGVPWGDDQAPALPLSLTIGRWLLTQDANVSGAAWWGIAADASPAECLELGEKIADLAPRVALLAMGDGPGRRARGAPGARDPAADRYDEAVAAAMAAPSPGALAALDPAADADLFVAGRAAWQVLAGAAGRPEFTATLAYAAAPFEVSYVVATWRRAH
ncbi:MAG: hypothetical protein ABSA53_14785 [Streptosporangiaceae bacterium]